MQFLLALQFLTSLPVHLQSPPEPEDHGASLDWYGAVGLAIGISLAIIGWLAGHVLDPWVTAALVLAVWVLLTGAGHLAGLGGCADAFTARTRDQALKIMSGSHSGTTAAAVIALVLIIKFAALASIANRGDWQMIIVATVLGRVAIQALFLTTPAAHDNGALAYRSQYLDRDRVLVMMLVLTAIAIFFAGIANWWLLLIVLLMFAVVRGFMMKRLLGVTDNSASGMVELIEIGVLVSLA